MSEARKAVELVQVVTDKSSIPHGYCHCGCGQRTKICNNNDKARGRVKGQPFRYLQGHAPRKAHVELKYDPKIGKGFCHCGCGRKTSLAEYTMSSKGMVAGEPMFYVSGHNGTPSVPQYVVNEKTGCWEWQWNKNRKGYGRVRVGRDLIAAHTVFYEQKFGNVPCGKQLDHKCRNRRCVNPDHLEPVTCVENVRRGLVPTITIEIARDIKRDLRSMSGAAAARRHGVSRNIVYQIKNGVTWRDA